MFRFLYKPCPIKFSNGHDHDDKPSFVVLNGGCRGLDVMPYAMCEPNAINLDDILVAE